jgi:hypothetical protein
MLHVLPTKVGIYYYTTTSDARLRGHDGESLVLLRLYFPVRTYGIKNLIINKPVTRPSHVSGNLYLRQLLQMPAFAGMTASPCFYSVIFLCKNLLQQDLNNYLMSYTSFPRKWESIIQLF